MNILSKIVVFLVLLGIVFGAKLYQKKSENQTAALPTASVVEKNLSLQPADSRTQASNNIHAGEIVAHSATENKEQSLKVNEFLSPTPSPAQFKQAQTEMQLSNNSNPSSSSETSCYAGESGKSPPIKPESPAELTIYFPERSDLTKDQKIDELKTLVSIFRLHLDLKYKQVQIDYIENAPDRVDVLLYDGIEYYSDPISFEKNNNLTFIKTTMEFVETVHRLKKEAHQRYLSRSK